jgi:hypothetical protein
MDNPWELPRLANMALNEGRYGFLAHTGRTGVSLRSSTPMGPEGMSRGLLYMWVCCLAGHAAKQQAIT